MTEAQRQFVDQLAVYVAADPLTLEWLSPLEAMKATCYQCRFDAHEEGVARFLVYDDAFSGGQQWLTCCEFYSRSRKVATDLWRRGWIGTPVEEEDDALPTGAG